MDELKHAIALYESDIVCVNETHFYKDVLDAEIEIPGFKLFRKDRDFVIKPDDDANDRAKSTVSSGGGCIIYVNESLNPVEIGWFQVSDSIAIEFSSNIGRVNIACIYRSISLTQNQNDNMLNMLTKLVDHNVESLILGDFNLPNVTWLSGSLKGPSDTKNKGLINEKKFLDCFHNNGLTWYITEEVTRRRLVNGILQESTLDQVLSTNQALINQVEIVSPLGKSDHVGFDIDLNLFANPSKGNITPKINKQLWSKVSFKELLEKSYEIDWSYSSDVLSMSTEEMWKELCIKLQLVTDDVVPTKNSSKLKQPWVNSSLKRCRKNSDKCWALFDCNPTLQNLNVALSQQEKFDNLSLKCKTDFEKKITKHLKVNCKPFYAYLRGKRVLKDGVSSLEKPDGSLTQNNIETAEVLADAFASVYVNEPYGPLSKECYGDSEDFDINDLEITNEDVLDEFKRIDISKSQGPDGIHPKLLKALSSNKDFINSITKLFQACASSCKIPTQWKTANVTSIYKKGTRKCALNYRPVSLTCIVSKLYEKLVRRHILSFMSIKIDPNQHGFVEGKSCLSNLLESMECIIDMLEDGEPVDVFYLDFCKAFDSVPHYRLLTKLEKLGIKGKTLEIIRDFLSDRTFRTYVGGAFSKLRLVLSGIPQGSVLGPLLFLIFINDLPDCVQNISKLFADDLKVIVDASDKVVVLNMLNNLEKWQNLWLLKFNPAKCKVMHIPFNGNPMHDYTFEGVSLDSTDVERDLGVLTTPDLSWKQNIQSCISKANSMIAWVTRNLITRDLHVMRNVYKCIIRPHLEYCAQLWSPPATHGNWSVIIELESVQRRFTRLIDGIGTAPYSGRLEALQLTTLAERRIRGDLIEVFKIVNGLVEYGTDLFCVSRSGNKLISMPSKSSDKVVRKISSSFISERVISYWNKLPRFVKCSESVNDFKINIEVFKCSCPDIDTGNFWEVSDLVLSKIEGNNYLENKEKHVKFLTQNPSVAKRKGINIF